MGKQRFTFADAKKKIQDLEDQLIETKKKAGNLILDTSDHVFTKKELGRIKFLEIWSVLGPIIAQSSRNLIFSNSLEVKTLSEVSKIRLPAFFLVSIN